MATKVGLQNNFLKIDNGKKPIYFTASWCSLEFENNEAVITDQGRGPSGTSVKIPYNDFQESDGTPRVTADEIATYLSDKIG